VKPSCLKSSDCRARNCFENLVLTDFTDSQTKRSCHLGASHGWLLRNFQVLTANMPSKLLMFLTLRVSPKGPSELLRK